MTVLVVIPCLNEAAHLPGLLKQLRAEASDGSVRIVVADGGSVDASRAIVLAEGQRRPHVHLLDNPERLQGPGINAAVEAFGEGCDYLVRIDAHAGYPPLYVSGLIRAARAHGADSVVVPMRTVGFDCFQTAVATAQNSAIGTGGAAHRTSGRGGWVDHGHHALMRMEAFVGVGGYDDRFSHNEDAELDLRLAAAGRRIWMEASLAIDYLPRSTPRALFRQYYNYGRGRARTVRLHRERLKPRQALPLLVFPAVLGLAAAPIFGALHPALLIAGAPALFWLAACLAGGSLAALKSNHACAHAAGLAAMIMHLAWSAGFWREWLLTPRLPPRQSVLTLRRCDGTV